MYQQPLRPQQTWSSAQFAQGPKPPTVSTWASAPIITTVHNAAASAVPVPHPAAPQSFVPPVPPGVNPQQWQNGRWMYTAPAGGVAAAQPHGPYPPPSLVGWNVPAGWGITPQYYYPPQTQKQPDRSYWDTKLTDNGLGLENMHIKQPTAPAASGGSRDKGPHTPWAWVPRELDDEDPPQAGGSSAPYHRAPQPQQPSPVAPGGTSGIGGLGRQTGTATAAAAAGTGYPGQGHGHPPHAYFSVPADQQQHQHQHQQAVPNDASSRPALPPPAIFSAHARQHSNPHQTAATTHAQPSTSNFPGSQSTTLPSQPTPSAQALQRSHMLVAPTPQRPGEPESYTTVRQLRPTFSPAIVRTPNHYRYDSQPMVPSPLVAPWEEASGNNKSAGISTSANKHLSGPINGVVPSPRVLPWNTHARVNDPDSPTPSPRHPRTSRTEPPRIYESARPVQPVQRSYSIPEPPRLPAPVSRQNSMPLVPTADHHGQSCIANLPHFAEEPGAMLSPLLGTVSSESSESSTATIVIAPSPPPLFIPPRYSHSPSPSPYRRRPRRASRSSSPPASDSDDSEDDDDDDVEGRSPHHRYRSPSASRSRHSTYSGHSGHSSGHSSGHYVAYPGAHTPQGRSPASSTHTHRSSSSSNPLPTPPQERRDPGFSLPPPQMPRPPRGTYRAMMRFGFWNRRGDYLTTDKYVVYAPPDRANPPELERYPSPTEGYMDHFGNFIKYDAKRLELPESLPRQGHLPLLPYDKFVTYVYL